MIGEENNFTRKCSEVVFFSNHCFPDLFTLKFTGIKAKFILNIMH